ncbi:NADH-quinone oxidoreductase subunit NuoE [Geoalkalibacter halelectricus]|uniref:NADH-quinone oxidoreductase subunit NuoE n=1 Tax=Geoalkalibacter halelectricus TaxID=2847045 RepID=A0ABY5ZMC2_9BACT|nr:NADH-quinone oxidoreductase subunit NuoE [Geoalkalibacter halelectricus]MDO3378686.1 NADH-quinone oxidoreductase subunit NuoE [Geoalkalibacter halelectricus]UWZ80004.1 NADH-quinone oxidoreductase subunit NuoE [Geoalkalibacter halelectricus]
MSQILPQDQIDAWQEKLADHQHPMELAVDVLRAIQHHHGWVPDEGVELAARLLGTTPLKVEELATFYDKIYRRPVGRRVIRLCDSICCWSRGGEDIAAYLQKKLGITLGETSSDGAFTLLPSCCLGACGEAPAMMIGLKLHGNLTVERIDQILAAEGGEARP